MDTTTAPDVDSGGFGPYAMAGFASLGAAAIHAGAIGIHANDHRQAALVFTALAVLQGAWGVAALVKRDRGLAVAGLILHAGALGGWALAKSGGIGFVDGLEQAEGLGWADVAGAALAALALVFSARGLLVGATGGPEPGASLMRRARPTLAAAVAVTCLLSLSTLDSHSHAPGPAAAAPGGGDGHNHAPGGGGGPRPGEMAASVPPQPYDPELPIDLSGVAGVTPEQEARAERLLAITLDRLPRFADVAVAESLGFHSIGDGFTGHEHFINWDYIDDDHILNPDYPESLVYEVDPITGERTLVSAMFMLATGTSLRDVPDLGGALTQWHIHDDLCFSDDPVAPRVVGVTSVGGTCRGGTEKLDPVPMIHVWITKHPCGPFAALEGVAAGQVAAGETHMCNEAHGSHG